MLEATIEGEDGRKMIGLTFAEQPDSIGMHVNMAVRTSLNYARLVWVSLGMLVSGQVGVDQLSGPVGVAKMCIRDRPGAWRYGYYCDLALDG